MHTYMNGMCGSMNVTIVEKNAHHAQQWPIDTKTTAIDDHATM